VNGPFSSFVIFAAMRTGSNFLEKSLAAVPGLTSHGEAFNPKFTGYPNRTDLLGIDVATRDKDPLVLLDRVRAAPGLNGFRYFPTTIPACWSRFWTTGPVQKSCWAAIRWKAT
jgi:hypothetical protein